MPICSFSSCVESCQQSSDCPSFQRNCIDGGCRNCRCFINSDCASRERCLRGRCARRRPRPKPIPLPPQRRRVPWSETGVRRVPGSGPTIIPAHLKCPFYSLPSDASSNVKCQRVFCRCNSGADCQPFKPPWARGPMKCCLGACVLAEADSCARRADARCN